jgi:hypothetical protein
VTQVAATTRVATPTSRARLSRACGGTGGTLANAS